MSNVVAAPSPKGTNYERLFVVKRTGARMAHDASPNAEQFPKGLKPAGSDRSKRWSGRDGQPLNDALDALQSHLQNCIGDDEDFGTAQELLSTLLEAAMPDAGGEDSEASNDPEAQRKSPDNFAGQDRGKRMAGDRAPAGKLERILAAKTR